jgi:hypothetical protein
MGSMLPTVCRRSKRSDGVNAVGGTGLDRYVRVNEPIAAARGFDQMSAMTGRPREGDAYWQRHYGGVGGRWTPTAAGRRGCMIGLVGLLALVLATLVVTLVVR